MNNVREFQTARDRKSFNFNTISNSEAAQGKNVNITNQNTNKKTTEQSHKLGASPSYAPMSHTNERSINTKNFKGMAVRTIHDDLYLPTIPQARNYQGL